MEILTLLSSYQRHENELKTILEYVDPIEAHDLVFSQQIAKHLLNSGIAVEGVFKKIGNLLGQQPGNIEQYKTITFNEFPNISNFEIQIALTNRIIKPLENWGNTRLSWWDNYTDLKHNYFSNINKGCLGEAIKAISVYLILILYFGYLEHNRSYPHIPSALAPSLLIPKDYSNSSFESGGFYLQYPLLL